MVKDYDRESYDRHQPLDAQDPGLFAGWRDAVDNADITDTTDPDALRDDSEAVTANRTVYNHNAYGETSESPWWDFELPYTIAQLVRKLVTGEEPPDDSQTTTFGPC